MKTERLLRPALAATAVALAMTASAAGQKLTVTHSGGSTQMDIPGITKITFDQGRMHVSSADGNQSFDLGDIDKIDFDLNGEPTGSSVTSVIGNIKISYLYNALNVTAPEGPLTLEVYTVNGTAIAKTKGENNISFDFSQMPKGIYIVKINDKTIKLTR